MPIFRVTKQYGETMGQLLDRVRKDEHISRDVPMTYAGRLDPAASGECILLSGPDVHFKDEYLNRDKVYKVSIMIGVRTDSDDLLGVIESVDTKTDDLSSQCPIVIDGVRALPKHIMQRPHEFSGYRVSGKSLWAHRRSGGTVPLPQPKKRTLYDIRYENSYSCTGAEVIKQVSTICNLVDGDFRTDEIMRSWDMINVSREFPVLQFTMRVSAGTYIRSLVRRVSSDIRVPLVLFALERISITP